MAGRYRHVLKLLMMSQSFIVVSYIIVLQSGFLGRPPLPEEAKIEPWHGTPSRLSQYTIDSLDGKNTSVPVLDIYDRATAALLKNISISRPVLVAIGLALTTVSAVEGNMTSLPFLNTLLVSFCATASGRFTYNFYVGYDYDDRLLSQDLFRRRLTSEFHKFIASPESNCPPTSDYHLHYVECNHSGKPAWAQNDAMMEAYLQGNDYFFRINDDTRLKTSWWTEYFIKVLRASSPPNVGVVGPNHLGGNRRILTYDFVHRSHMEIFGFYYPREYTGWYADGWITDVYLPSRACKIRSIILRHTRDFGRRYNVSEMDSLELVALWNRDKLIVSRYLIALEEHNTTVDPRKVISMVISDDRPDLIWGAVRNAQLRQVFYPNWTLRVYLVNPNTKKLGKNIAQNYHEPVKSNFSTSIHVSAVLQSLGVDVRIVRNKFHSMVPQTFWNVLVADDPSVTAFLVRSPSRIFSREEADAVNSWLSGDAPVHSIRGHRSHDSVSIVDGLWAAKAEPFRRLFGGTSVETLVNEYARSGRTKHTFVQSFLQDEIWPRVKNEILYHHVTYDTECLHCSSSAAIHQQRISILYFTVVIIVWSLLL